MNKTNKFYSLCGSWFVVNIIILLIIFNYYELTNFIVGFIAIYISTCILHYEIKRLQ
jgi:hypothetical protein